MLLSNWLQQQRLQQHQKQLPPAIRWPGIPESSGSSRTMGKDALALGLLPSAASTKGTDGWSPRLHSFMTPPLQAQDSRSCCLSSEQKRRAVNLHLHNLSEGRLHAATCLEQARAENSPCTTSSVRTKQQNGLCDLAHASTLQLIAIRTTR